MLLNKNRDVLIIGPSSIFAAKAMLHQFDQEVLVSWPVHKIGNNINRRSSSIPPRL